MTSTALHPPTVRLHHALVLAAAVLALGLAAAGTWVAVDRLTGNAAAAKMYDGVPLWPPLTFPQRPPAEREFTLAMQLAQAGYGIDINGTLDPVMKSALADFVRPDASHPLDPYLVEKLEGTVITGRRDPAAWNARFGRVSFQADLAFVRQRSIVERPLSGPGGQLDEHGNVVQR
jgi:hypothetical protein